MYIPSEIIDDDLGAACREARSGRSAQAAAPPEISALKGVGHFLHLENPQQVADLVVAHLKAQA